MERVERQRLGRRVPVRMGGVGWLMVALGAWTLMRQVRIFAASGWHADEGWVGLLGVAAVVLGLLLARGVGWARWWVVAWLSVHVVVGFLNGVADGLVHLVVVGVVIFLLFDQEARETFRRRTEEDGER